MKKVFFCGLSLFFCEVFSLKMHINIHRTDNKIEITDCLKNIQHNFEREPSVIFDNAVKIVPNTATSFLEVIFANTKNTHPNEFIVEEFVIDSVVPLSFYNLEARTAKISCVSLYFGGTNRVENLDVNTGRFTNKESLISRKIRCKAGGFFNEKQAQLGAVNLEVNLCGIGSLINDGTIETEQFKFCGGVSEFVQNGILDVQGMFNLDGHFYSNGETLIGDLLMPPFHSQQIKKYIRGEKALYIDAGNFQVTSFTVGKDAQVGIGEMTGTVKTFGNNGGVLHT